MSFEPFELQQQLGAGLDGISYQAVQTEGTKVELRSPHDSIRSSPRWASLARRLKQFGLLQHPGARRLIELKVDAEPPFFVLNWFGGQNLFEWILGGTLDPPQILGALRQLVEVLTEGHRLGLVHGDLSPATVELTAAWQLQLDFSALDCRGREMLDEWGPIEEACRPPEWIRDFRMDAALDVFAVGAISFWLVMGRKPPKPNETFVSGEVPEVWSTVADHWRKLWVAALAPDPSDRPGISQLANDLKALTAQFAMTAGTWSASETRSFGPDLAAPSSPTVPRTPIAAVGQMIGRYKLDQLLGQGGMGSVYRAEDTADGSIVALKVLHGQVAVDPQSRRRFFKEARLLAQVRNAYVANLLEFNQEGDLCYLVTEFVPGKSAGTYLVGHQAIPERTGLSIVCDVSRALSEAHKRGIVHRDIKPDNILLTEPLSATRESSLSLDGSISDRPPRAKLTDFGIAREINQSASLSITQAGNVLGTPLYMSPEQWDGRQVDPRADVYALGATLFHFLAGRPPYEADELMALVTKHCADPVPSLREANATVSEAVDRIVRKTLSKDPADRYGDAEALLLDLERVLRGEPTGIEIHPRLPDCPPDRVIGADYIWELKSSPTQLWPHVSNTERLNKAIGLPPVHYDTVHDPEKGMRRFATVKLGPLVLKWEEHPFEWIENRKMGVLRLFSAGPFKWFVNMLDLTPRAGGGTTLRHSMRMEPNGFLGKLVAVIETKFKAKHSLDRTYKRIDSVLSNVNPERPWEDLFEATPALVPARRKRLEDRLQTLSARPVELKHVQKLGQFLAEASEQDVARVRPKALARKLGIDPQAFLDICFYAAREGLLTILWDILCPICRIPSEVQDKLSLMRDHGHCEACNLDFDLDFGNSVELIFRAHPEIREVETRTYCVGGPGHNAHVTAQVRVAPGERVELGLALPEGAYLLRGPQLPFQLEFPVRKEASTYRWDLELGHNPGVEMVPTLRAGGQLLVLTNDQPRELLVRVERTASRQDAVTAAFASSLGIFRELFPQETLSPGKLAAIPTVTFLVVLLDQASNLYLTLGDLKAFDVLHKAFSVLTQSVQNYGGSVIKTLASGIQAVFQTPEQALRAALDMQPALSAQPLTQDLLARISIHRGPAMLTTFNNRLDYFGSTINTATVLLRGIKDGELILSQDVYADPEVAQALRGRPLTRELLTARLPGDRKLSVQRVSLPRTNE